MAVSVTSSAALGGLSRSCALVAERRLMARPSLSVHGARLRVRSMPCWTGVSAATPGVP